MYNKKALNVDLGKFTKSNPHKNDMIVDPMGQWKYPGQNTRIPGSNITMQGVNYPVWAQPNIGPGMMMQPGQDYQFPGADYVDEFPQMQKDEDYIEADLTPEEIDEYRNGGYIVEELPQAQKGIEVTAQANAPTQQQRWDATMDWYNTNPYAEMPAWNKLAPADITKGPMLTKEGILDIPYGGKWNPMDPENPDKPHYELIQQPEDYIGLPIYRVNGKPMSVDPDFNKQFLKTYSKGTRGTPEYYHIYGQGLPYNPELKSTYDMRYPNLNQKKEGGPIVNKSTDEVETFAYAKAADKELWKNLMDKTKAIMNTSEGKKLWKQEIKPKNFSIKELQRFTEGVKEFNQEAQNYERARRKVKEKKISTSDFERMYEEKDWSKFDKNVKTENYKGEYQDAVNKSNVEKEKNMWLTDAVMEFTGAPSLQRIAQDPIGAAKGVGQTIADVASLPKGLATGAYNYATDGNFNMGQNIIGQNYGEGLDETLDVLGVLPGIGGASKLAKFTKPGQLIGDLTTQTPLKNAWKLNPKALKENPEMFLYRARPVGQNPDMNMAATLRAKEAAGEPLTWVQKNIIKMSEGTVPDMGGINAREKYYGRWFDNDPNNLNYYINPDTRNFADNDVIEILRSKLPRAEADKLKVFQFEDAKSLSGFPEREFILPIDKINTAEKFPESSLQQLIREDAAFNKPHWFKGYGSKTPNQLPGSSVASSVDDAGTDIVQAGFDGNFITRPLTPFSKNELTAGKQWYRKIGNEAGLKDLINKQGAQAPAPMKMKSGIMLDAPFFGRGTAPAESYKGLYAAEVKPEAASKYHWRSRVAGVDNYGSVPFSNDRLLQNVPLEDLNVYRKKWFSNNYRKLDPENLQAGLNNAALQRNLENAYKWGIRGVTADQLFNDGQFTNQIIKTGNFDFGKRGYNHPDQPTEFQNGGSMAYPTSPFSLKGDTLTGVPKANINIQEWDKYKQDYTKRTGVSIPANAYLTQASYDSYLSGSDAHSWEAEEIPPIRISDIVKKTPVHVSSTVNIPSFNSVEKRPIVTPPVQKELPKKYAYRSQTIIDPITRKWTLQQVPYTEYVPGKGWVDLDAPRVVGNESNFQRGGEFIEMELTPAQIRKYRKNGYIIEDI